MIWPWPRRRTASISVKTNGGKTPPGRGRGGNGGQGGGKPSPNSAFGVATYRSSSQSISDVTTTAISWTNELQDDAGFWTSGAATRFTVPAGMAGWYLIVAGIAWATNGNSNRRLSFRKNGSTTWPIQSNYPWPSPQVTKTGGGLVTYLADNDYIEVLVWQGSAGPLNVTQADGVFIRLPTTKACQVRLTASEGIANTGTTSIPYDAEDRDDGGFWNSGQPTRMTVPDDGWYLFTVQSDWTNAADHAKNLELRVNGSSTWTGNCGEVTSSTPFHWGNCFIIKLNAGDYVEARVSQNSGTNPLNMTIGYFSVAKVASGSAGSNVFINTNKTIANNSDVAPSWDGERVDELGLWTSGTPGRMTIPSGKSGWYIMTASSRWNTTASNGGRETNFRKNGSTLYSNQWHSHNYNGSEMTRVNAIFAQPLVATDYIEVIVRQNTSGNQTMNLGEWAMVKL